LYWAYQALGTLEPLLMEGVGGLPAFVWLVFLTRLTVPVLELASSVGGRSDVVSVDFFPVAFCGGVAVEASDLDVGMADLCI
jgi:hypothetical protein